MKKSLTEAIEEKLKNKKNDDLSCRIFLKKPEYLLRILKSI